MGYKGSNEDFNIWEPDSFLQSCPLFVGDYVMLASGGPLMEVRNINKSGVKCRWKIVGTETQYHTFNRVTVLKIL